MLLKRVGKEFISSESIELMFALPVVGLIAALVFLFFRRFEGPLSVGAEWLFRTATDLDINVLFWVFGLAALLVATHKPIEKQSLFPRRLLMVPLLRLTSDTASAATSAFLTASVWCLINRSTITLGEGAAATFITARSAFAVRGARFVPPS